MTFFIILVCLKLKLTVIVDWYFYMFSYTQKKLSADMRDLRLWQLLCARDKS